MSRAVGLALLLDFAVVARGAHDLWAATAACLGVLVLALAAVGGSWRRGAGLSFPLAPYLGAGLAAAFLSFLGSVNPGESFVRWLDLACAALYFWTAFQTLQGSREREVFLACVAPVLAVELGASLYHRLEETFRFPDWRYAWRQWTDRQEVGTLVNANAAATFLIAWPALLLDRAKRSRARERAFWSAVLAADLLALGLAGSAWAWCCLLASVPWLRGPRRWRLGPVVWALILAALAGVLALKALLASREVFGGTIGSRLAWWAAGWDMFESRPWLGVGVGAYPSAYLAHHQEHGLIRHSRFAHSLPLGTLAQTGLVGLGALLALAWAFVARLRAGGERLREAWPFILGLGIILLHLLLNPGFEYLANLLAFAALAALALPPERVHRRAGPFAFAVAAGLALCALPYIVAPWLSSRRSVEGERALAQDRWAEAEAHFAAASAMDGRSSEARRGRARALFARYRATGDDSALEDALSVQRQATRLDRLNGEVWGELGEYLAAAGDRPGTIEALERAVKLRSLDRRFAVLLRALKERDAPVPFDQARPEL
ncbi:MAG: O-antigen ligase family protein [Elusimicrobia bacterium]|nr:O-antigen ligase family protein [Elusimicrobiota bacterium]